MSDARQLELVAVQLDERRSDAAVRWNLTLDGGRTTTEHQQYQLDHHVGDVVNGSHDVDRLDGRWSMVSLFLRWVGGSQLDRTIDRDHTASPQ